MALRLRRVFSLSCPLLKRSLHQPKPISPISSHFLSTLISTTSPAAAVVPSSNQLTRSFTSTPALFAKPFDPDTDEIGSDTILFEGCDYNHWLITVDFKEFGDFSREQKIETYVNLATKIFGSLEEAKKRIYALSTTTYDGFQVQCTEEVSDRFKEFPEVVFVLPDSYIDPVNKEYGGDKYINGEIIPRPPPVHYGRQNRDRRQPQQNYGAPRQQNYGAPRQQNYGAPQQQNYVSPQHQNYGLPQQKNNEPPPQQGYGLPIQQGNGPPQHQNNGLPQQQNNGLQRQQGYGPSQEQSYGLPKEQSNVPPYQQNNVPQYQQSNVPQYQQSNVPQYQQSNVPPHQQSNVSPQQQGYASQQSFGAQGSGDRRSFTPQSNEYQGGQRDFQQGSFQRHVPTQQNGFSQDAEYGSPRGGNFEQAPGPQRNY